MAEPHERYILAAATATGAYLLLSAAGTLFPRAAAEDLLNDLRASPASAHATGAVAFFVGAGLLILNPGWSDPLRILLSLTALWWLVEGAATLAVPRRLFAHPRAATHLRRMTLFAFPTGLALIALSVFQMLKALP